MSVTASSSGPILVHENPLHLLATFDDDSDYDEEELLRTPPEQRRASNPQTSPMKQSLTKTLENKKNDLSHHKTHRVYIDSVSGSDSHPVGSRQEPFQSLNGAVKAREGHGPVQVLPTYYFKKRFVDSLEKFDPVKIPHTAIPIEVGGYVTEWWYLVEPSNLFAARAKVGLPPTGNVEARRSSIQFDKSTAERFKAPVSRDDAASVDSSPPNYDEATKKTGGGFLKKLLTR